jgi:hypothetical protein
VLTTRHPLSAKVGIKAVEFSFRSLRYDPCCMVLSLQFIFCYFAPFRVKNVCLVSIMCLFKILVSSLSGTSGVFIIQATFPIFSVLYLLPFSLVLTV